MVQILPKVPTFGEEFGRALGIGAGEGIQSIMERKRTSQLKNEMAESLRGEELSESQINMIVNNPEAQKAYFKTKFQAPEKKKQAELIQAQLDEIRQGQDFYNQLIAETGGRGQGISLGNMLRGAPELGLEAAQEAETGAYEALGLPAPYREPREPMEKRPPQKRIDYADPTSWSDEQVRKFSALSGKGKAGLLGQMAQGEAKRREVKNIYVAAGDTPEEAERKSFTDSPETARNYFTQKSKQPKPSPFQQKFESKMAEDIVTALHEGPKLRDSLSNIGKLRQLTKSLSGPGGMAKALLNTETAAEFNSLAFQTLEPIIKIFNPTGAIPQRKIETLKKEFTPKATELTSTIQGKINTLERLASQALLRNQAIQDLIDRYEGNPPQKELNRLFTENEKFVDDAISEVRAVPKEGTTAEPEFYEGYYSTANGRPLKPIPAAEARELMKQGLITNVRPQ